MKLLISLIITTTILCFSATVFAIDKNSKAQNFDDIRADILATITSINEIRLIMINSNLDKTKNTGNQASSKKFTRLTTNVSKNNNTLTDLLNEAKSNNIRLSILENSTFSIDENNFNDYITTSTSKKFNIKLVQSRRDSLDCDPTLDSYTYIRTPNDNGIDIIETITRYDISGKICFQRDNVKRKTASELLYLSSKNKIYNDYPVNDIATYTKPVIVLTSTMKKGKSFGSGGIITYESNGSSNTLVFNKVSTVLDNEAEITLIVNNAEKTYLNCLIIGTRSNSTVSTEWYCPGDGLVKRVIFYPGVADKPSRSEIITLKTIELD